METEAPFVARSPGSHSPPCLEVGSRGLARPIAPVWLLPAPTVRCSLYQPPLVRAQKRAPVAPGGPSKSPWKPKRHNGEGCARASPAGERGLGTRKGGNGGGGQGPLEEARTG